MISLSKDNTSVVMNRKERDLVSSPLAPTAGRWMDVANGEDDSGCHPLLHWLIYGISFCW